MIVVGTPNRTLTKWGKYTVVSPVAPANGSRQALWDAIRTAMYRAVEVASLGEPIFQCDVVCIGDPHGAEPVGAVRLLTLPVSHQHACPRGFIIYTEAVRQQVLLAWQSGRACTAWAEVPKVADYLPATHPPRRAE